jgi:hypothetical protein
MEIEIRSFYAFKEVKYGKEKFTLEQATKAQRRSSIVTLLFP